MKVDLMDSILPDRVWLIGKGDLILYFYANNRKNRICFPRQGCFYVFFRSCNVNIRRSCQTPIVDRLSVHRLNRVLMTNYGIYCD